MKKILHAIYDANGAPRSGSGSVGDKLFLPIAGGLVALFIFMAGGLYWQYVRDYDRRAETDIEAATRIYRYSVTDYQAAMNGIVSLLAADERLPGLLLGREAERLNNMYDQTFMKMRQDSGLNHLLFADSRHRIITILHQPNQWNGQGNQGSPDTQGEWSDSDGQGAPSESYGQADSGGQGRQGDPDDTLHRTSLGTMNLDKGRAYTLDVGPDGLLSLLVVAPIYSDGKLAGFIEAGMGLERALNLARQPKTVEVLLALDKTYISQERVSLLPSDGPLFWQDPGGGFLVYTTFDGANQEFNQDLRGHFETTGYSGDGQYSNFSTGDKRYAVSSQPLFDSSGTILGGLFILSDITPVRQEYYGTSLMLLMTMMTVATVVYFAFRHRVRDTDRNIASLECALEDGELLFESVFSRSETGFIMRDVKKDEALKANEVAMNACSADCLEEVDISRLQPVPEDSPVLRQWGSPLMTTQFAGRNRYFEVSSFTTGRDCVECTTIREVTDGVALLLEESQAHKLLHSILWQLPGWVCIKDSSLRLLHSNRTFRLLFLHDGVTVGIIRHSNWLGAGMDKMLEADRKALEEGVPVSYELTVPTERGDRIFAVTSQRFIGRNGEKCVLSSGHDITERVRMTEQISELHQQAEQAVQAKTQFIAHMSHEMRTPMHAVLGMSHLALGLSSDVRISEYLGKIQGSAQNLMSVINGILDLVQLETGDARLHCGSFDLSFLLDEVELQTRRLIRGKNIEFKRDTPAPSGRFVGDAARLRQILLILCGNAVKFTEAGWIRLDGSLTEKDGAFELRLAVEDSGIGIAPECLSNLFDNFYQVDGGMNRKQGGVGLGLALAKLAVELMGGRLEVSSELGKGSRFTFAVRLQPLTRQGLNGQQFAASSIGGAGAKGNDDGRSGLNGQFAPAVQSLDAVPVPGWVNAPDAADALGGFAAGLRLDGPGEAVGPDEPGISNKQGKTGGLDAIPMPGSTDGLGAIAMLGEPGVSNETVRPGQVCSVSAANVLGDASIMVVEDNQLNREIIVEVLEQAGARAVAVTDGQAALDILQQQSFDLILMDLQMPVMDGLEAARRIRALESASIAMIPIIALTANTQESDRRNCVAVGMNDFIAKPLDVQLLYDKLKLWLDDGRGKPDQPGMPV
ncbi:MAG: response regulator [Deltaproteobacteria bacterium]|jgi:signal transduction histidine kinase/ActR/RegA family two-component response regulator|nr:response regulator [Deltaproteobacteria bacterium]